MYERLCLRVRVGVSITLLLYIMMSMGCSNDLTDDSLDQQLQHYAAPSAIFGTYCQDKFQDPALTKLPNAYSLCSSFNGEMESAHTKKYYYTLTGIAKQLIEQTSDHLVGGADTVDLLFIATHGGAWANRFVLTLHEDGELISSNNMRLGDNANRLSIFATYSCDTMSTVSPNAHAMADRWRPVFRGGLRYAMAGHGDLWFYGNKLKMRRVGKRFAKEMNSGTTFKSAWSMSVLAPSKKKTRQHPAVLTTGMSASDASNRRDYMTLKNFENYPRLRDTNVKAWAWTQWNALD